MSTHERQLIDGSFEEEEDDSNGDECRRSTNQSSIDNFGLTLKKRKSQQLGEAPTCEAFSHTE